MGIGYFKSVITTKNEPGIFHPGSSILNEHTNQSIKEGDDYLMSNKVNKFILPDGTEVNLAGESGISPRQQMQNTDTNVTLQPNKLYVFPEMTSLTVTLAEPSDANVSNEYHFFFTSGATATTLTLNDVLSDTYSVDANMKYEVSILEGVAYIKGVSMSEA